MIEAILNEQKLIPIGLDDLAGDLYPLATIRDPNGIEVAESPITFTHIADGIYHSFWTPSTLGDLSLSIHIYEDAGYSVRSLQYEPYADLLYVQEVSDSDKIDRLLAHSGENVRDVVTAYGPSGDVQTATRWLYATPVDAENDVNPIGRIDVTTEFNPILPDVLLRKRVT